MDEEWRPVVGFEGFYEVSSKGRVKSIGRIIGKIGGSRRKIPTKIKIPNNHIGYSRVCLGVNGKIKKTMVHRMVAQSFIQNPDNLPFVNHKNGIKDDNNVNNLEWCTHQQNITHCIEVLKKVSKGFPNKKFYSDKGIPYPGTRPVISVDEKGNVIKEFESLKAAAKFYNLRDCRVWDFINGQRKHKSLIFKYKKCQHSKQS